MQGGTDMVMGDAGMHRILGSLTALVLVVGCASSNPTGGQQIDSARILYVELVVANDHARYQRLQANTEIDTGDLINLVNEHFRNSASFTRYTPQIILVGQRTATAADADPLQGIPHDATTGMATPLEALQMFADYQYAKLSSSAYAHDAALLLFERPEVEGRGTLAYTWQVCDEKLGAAVVRTGGSSSYDASLIAHALGHNLGMCHDPPATRSGGSPGCRTLTTGESASTCAGHIMSATSSPTEIPTRFSTCSAGDLDDFIDNRIGVPNCLMTPVAGIPMDVVEEMPPER
jgi:hypothetical protein